MDPSESPPPPQSNAVPEIDFSPEGQPHDAYFKRVFSDITTATQFFQNHLSATLVEGMDWTTLTLVPSTFIGRTLQQSQADLLFSVQAGGQSMFLFLLFEHQTSVDPTMPLRMLTYMVEIWWAHCESAGLPLPPVIPFVLHQGPKKWNVSTQFAHMLSVPPHLSESLTPFLPKFEHALLDLTRVDPANEESQDSLRMILQLMKLARQKDRMLDFFQWLGRELILVPEALINLSLLYALHSKGDLDVERIASTLKSKLTLKEKMTSLAERLREEGLKKGNELGVWRGKIQLLETLLQLPETSIDKLNALDLTGLEQRFNELQAEYSSRFKAR